MLTLTIKVGSNVLASKDGSLNVDRMTSLVTQIAELHKAGHRLIFVSSGAVAAGRTMVKGYEALDPVARRQLLSSIGQVKLIDTYKRLFDKHGIAIAQLLVTKQDFGTRMHYLNMKSCIMTLWENNVIPVVNENDAVSLTGLMFTDNDELSGLMASMMDCEKLFILSNINGIYNGDPSDPGSSVITEVAKGKSLAQYIQTTKSDFGRGGMQTKCRMAQKTAQAGIDVYIANGNTENVIVRLAQADPSLVRTHFEAGEHSSAVKKWIAYSDGFAKAKVVINKGAQDVLCASGRASSLLPTGVTNIIGDFKKDDIILICNEEGNSIGVGRASMDKDTAVKQSNAKKQKPLVHYDYLYIFAQEED